MLKEARTQLIEDLVTGSDGEAEPVGIDVYDTWPAMVSPPAALVVPGRGGSYVASGPGLPPGVWVVSLDVWLLISKKTPSSQEQEDLDLLIEKVLVNTIDWAVTGVDPTTLMTFGSSEYPCSVVHLSKQVKQ